MPLQGNLREMSLANLVQVNCQEMRSAHLTLAFGGRVGEVYFSDGQVTHAALGPHTGERALFELLGWDDGTFKLETDVAAPAQTINTPWPELLLEGMKLLSAWKIDDERDSPVAARILTDAAMAQRLKAIGGVSGAIVAASDGVVLATHGELENGEKDAAVAVFAGSAAAQIGDTLQLGGFAQAVVTMKSHRVLVLAHDNRYVGLWLDDNASPAIVGQAATQVLR